MAKSNKKKKPVKKRVTKKKNKSNIPPKLIIGGVFFLILSIIAILILNIKVDKLKTQKQKIIKHNQEIVTTKKIDQYIVLLLNEIKKNNDFIILKDINAYENNFEMLYKIKLDKKYRQNFKNKLTNFLRKYNFFIEDKGNKINFYKTYQEVTIIFLDKKKEPVPIENKNPKISIILDDAGRDLTTLDRILKLPYPITISTIPFLKYDIETVKRVKKAGKTPFLHLPCQPKSYPKTDPGKGAIFTNSPQAIIDATVKKVFIRLYGVEGFNNHMGSALTEDAKKMKQVLNAAKKYTKIFVDSRTTPHTVAYDICKQTKGLKCGMNRKFIDNENNHEYIKARLDDAMRYAKKYGKVIIIGHLKPDTVDVLLQYIPVMEKQGFQFVNIKEVLH